MKFFALICLLIPGCQQFTQTQLDLVTQARRGIASVAIRHDESADVAHLRRQQLDGAFDADVRAQQALSADWIIEARKAYAAAIDAYAKQQAAATAAREQDKRNLAAADAALAKLQSLLEMQRQISIEELGK